MFTETEFSELAKYMLMPMPAFSVTRDPIYDLRISAILLVIYTQDGIGVFLTSWATLCGRNLSAFRLLSDFFSRL
jgi:hypothetical protein